MTLTNFIGEVWSARVLYNLNKALVYGQIGVCNKEYEGEIKNRGDSVHINAIAPVTSRPYVKNVAIATPDTLSDAATTLVIDQSNYTNFEIDDIDKAQSNANILDAATAEASYALGDDADQYIAAQMVANVAVGNKIGTDEDPIVPGTSTGTTTFDYLVDLSVLLNEANAPKVGRWVILPPHMIGGMVKDERFSNISASGSPEALRNGYVTRVAGFDVLESNNVPNTTGTLYKCLAGCTAATTYAEQIVDVEAYRPDDSFSDAVKALHLFGAKVIRPSALALLTTSKT
ncbi:MAG: phage capsid protein [Candidatus Bathyarchaeota archaeon]|nr:phage capsid protein [Candidatus Bathyarchaeota archaeon]